MPLFSQFTPFGHLAFSSRPAHGQTIYETLRDNFGDTFNVSYSGLQQARLYAQAMCLASAQYQIDRAANNGSPATATELLGVLERDHKIIPSQGATLQERRDYLSAYKRITRGNRREAIEDALRTLLGSDFIEYRTTARSEIVATPTDPALTSVFSARGAKKKVFSVNLPIATIGRPFSVPFTPVAGTDPPLAGESFSFDPDPRRNIERVTITAVADGQITAIFTKSHEPGTLAVSPHPYWISNQRLDTIVVSDAAAIDAEKRRKISELMARALRGVSQWQIVIASGFFTSDDPKLGLPNSVPVF